MSKNEFKKDIEMIIRTKVKNALKIVANETNARAEKFVPVWRGNLRRSMKVKMLNDEEVLVSSGDEETQDYVFPQYFKSLRHRGDYKTGLLNLTALYRDSAGAAKKTGLGERYLYARAYRLALENNAIQKLEPAQWYDRILNDKKQLQELTEIFTGVL